MAVDYTTLENDIQEFIVLATGLDGESVRPAYVNASAEPTRDRGLLISYNIINPQVIGQDAIFNTDKAGGDVTEAVYGDRNLTVSVKAYGSTARNSIETLALFLTSNAGTSFLNGKEIGYLRRGSVIDLSSLQNGSFEIRMQLDIEFHVVFSTTSTVNEMNNAAVTWLYQGSTTETGTIEVTP